MPPTKTLNGHDVYVDYPSSHYPKEVTRYRVVDPGGDPDAARDVFEAIFVRVDQDTFQSDNIQANELAGRDLGAAVLCDLKKSTKVVRSSSNKLNDGNEYRTEPAQKMWESMVRRGLAEYDEAGDRFYVK